MEVDNDLFVEETGHPRGHGHGIHFYEHVGERKVPGKWNWPTTWEVVPACRRGPDRSVSFRSSESFKDCKSLDALATR